MATMAEVLLERETVEGELAQALLDDRWAEYLAEHPEEAGQTAEAPLPATHAEPEVPSEEELLAEARAAAEARMAAE